MKEKIFLVAILCLMGAAWGLTIPLTKLAVSDGYRHFGLIFWQLTISVIVLGAITLVRRKTLPMARANLRLYLMVALLGTLCPNAASYQAAVYLPAGINAILISLVPMFAFPIALLMATDRFSWARFAGLLLGLIGVLLLVGPEASLPERWMVAFIPLALIAPAFYGLEGNMVAKWGMGGLDAIQVLLGASVVGALIALPLAVLSGHWIDPRPPYGTPDLALFVASMIHGLVYAAYVWMVARAGAVFAAQVSYLITGFGVIWAMILLDERYSGYVWAAMAVMFLALFLVQPRTRETVVPARQAGQTARQV